MSTVWTAATAIRSQTQQKARESVSLWVDGIDLLVESLTPLMGNHSDGDLSYKMRLGFLAHALNTQFVGYHTALTGFYAQAFLLVRICAEDWLAWWYVRENPDNASRFTPGVKAPEWNEMVQALVKDPALPERKFIDAERKWLNPLMHVDGMSVSATWGLQNGRSVLVFGPHFNARRFHDCTREFTQWLPPLIEAARAQCLELGTAPPPAHLVSRYRERRQQYLNNAATRRGTVPPPA